jgi:hypothetical protein
VFPATQEIPLSRLDNTVLCIGDQWPLRAICIVPNDLDLARRMVGNPQVTLGRPHVARRIASNVAKLPELLGAAVNSDWDFPEGGG